MRPIFAQAVAAVASGGFAVLAVTASAPAAAAVFDRAPRAVARAADPADRRAIMALLDTYSTAVTHKDRATFETLLLAKDIPFSYVPAQPTNGAVAAWRNYEDFRRGIFDGPSLTQVFEKIGIRQHGALADVDLVYVNRDAHGEHSGWKTMQLLKVGGRWKIASEFFTALEQPSS